MAGPWQRCGARSEPARSGLLIACPDEGVSSFWPTFGSDMVGRPRRGRAVTAGGTFMESNVLEVNRTDIGVTRIVTDQLDELADGAVRFRIERFSITANTTTYAEFGDMLDYWGFWPSGDDTFGRVPAMGWAIVVESNHPGRRSRRPLLRLVSDGAVRRRNRRPRPPPARLTTGRTVPRTHPCIAPLNVPTSTRPTRVRPALHPTHSPMPKIATPCCAAYS